MKFLSIIIPAHNEEKNIEKTIRDIFLEVRNVEVIVVCNNCSDKTFYVVGKIENKNILNLDINKNIGKGGAILEGLKYAKGEYIGYVDADGAFYVEDITRLVKELKDYDCVIGSKWINNSFFNVNEGFFKKIFGRIWNLFVNFLFNLKIRDSQAGMKFFRKEVLKKIDLKSFYCRGFDFDVELLHKVKKKKFKIKEILVKIKNLDKKSSFSYKSVFFMFINILKYKFLKSKKV
ncbi:hypothetical protein CL617_00705 [archaeon]|nr:hypothetical protein [archaeon]